MPFLWDHEAEWLSPLAPLLSSLALSILTYLLLEMVSFRIQSRIPVEMILQSSDRDPKYTVLRHELASITIPWSLLPHLNAKELNRLLRLSHALPSIPVRQLQAPVQLRRNSLHIHPNNNNHALECTLVLAPSPSQVGTPTVHVFQRVSLAELYEWLPRQVSPEDALLRRPSMLPRPSSAHGSGSSDAPLRSPASATGSNSMPRISSPWSLLLQVLGCRGSGIGSGGPTPQKTKSMAVVAPSIAPTAVALQPLPNAKKLVPNHQQRGPSPDTLLSRLIAAGKFHGHTMVHLRNAEIGPVNVRVEMETVEVEDAEMEDTPCIPYVLAVTMPSPTNTLSLWLVDGHPNTTSTTSDPPSMTFTVDTVQHLLVDTHANTTWCVQEIFGTSHSQQTSQQDLRTATATTPATTPATTNATIPQDPLASEQLCVICISDPAHVTILPCRHCCLCLSCWQGANADSQEPSTAIGPSAPPSSTTPTTPAQPDDGEDLAEPSPSVQTCPVCRGTILAWIESRAEPQPPVPSKMEQRPSEGPVILQTADISDQVRSPASVLSLQQ